MSDEFTQQLQSDLAQFRKLTSGSELERIQAIIHDYSLSFEQLGSALSPAVVSLLLALLIPEDFGLLGENIPDELSLDVASARIVAERELRNFLKHPAISRELAWRKEYERFQELARRALDENRGVHIVGDSYFEEEGGKLFPQVRVAFVGRDDGSSIVTTGDLEDVLVIAEDLIEFARQEAERCIPIAEKEMLKLSFGNLVGPVIRSIDTHLARIRELAPKLGIDLSKGEEERPKPAA